MFSLIAYEALKINIPFLITQNTRRKAELFEKHKSFPQSLKFESDKSLNKTNVKFLTISISHCCKKNLIRS